MKKWSENASPFRKDGEKTIINWLLWTPSWKDRVKAKKIDHE